MTTTKWRFLTHHALTFILISQDTRITTREIAECLEITERTIHRIVSDLEAAGYIRRYKEGRSNRYEVNTNQPIEHPALKSVPARELLQLFTPEDGCHRSDPH